MFNKKITLFALSAFMLLAIPQRMYAQFSFMARVVKVSDGDTITVLCGERTYKIRCYGIDAPEKGQDFGTKAKDRLAELVAGRMVLVTVLDVDRYGRLLAEIYNDGYSVNLEMLFSGLAWHYKEYDDSPRYSGAEAAARAQKRGLWAQPGAIPPWDYRKAGRS